GNTLCVTVPVSNSVHGFSLKLADLENQVRADPSFTGPDVRVGMFVETKGAFNFMHEQIIADMKFNGKSSGENLASGNLVEGFYDTAVNPDYGPIVAPIVAAHPQIILIPGALEAHHGILPQIEA